jgi:HB1, ASXL, restriction endonuclease HTH domain
MVIEFRASTSSQLVAEADTSSMEMPRSRCCPGSTTQLMLGSERPHEAAATTRRFKVNTKQAIEQVLTGRRKPMKVSDLIAAALPLATSLNGKTPKQTLYSVIYGEAKKPVGLVTQVERGTFRLNPKRRKSDPAPKAEKAASKPATTSRKRKAR